MDYIWVLFAFLCGLAVRMLGLPPMVGYLAAGFLLNYLGFQADQGLQALADLGITLMLFTIGLKLRVKQLYKTEVWLSTLSHMGMWVLLIGSIFFVFSSLALPFFTDMDFSTAALLGFALSFSSTVCIVKVLEESGEIKTRHGKVCIGVLVMQDIAAVVFLAIATAKTPSIWAFALIGLWIAKPLLKRLIEQVGHGELLPLTGFVLALGGHEIFELVHIKGDLGALLVGMLLSGHAKSTELSKALMSFKDIFLIGFFLSIGFTALPTPAMIGIALLLCAVLIIKWLMFFFILVGLKLRGRTAYLASMALSNFSEFGLIVAALSYQQSLLSKEWLVILALTVSISFIITSVLYRGVHTRYLKWKGLIRRFQRQDRLPTDVFVQPQNVEIIIIGLGRVGKAAHDALYHMIGDRVWGMDADPERTRQQIEQGMHVFAGDGEDADLWENLDLNKIKLILLAVPSIDDCKNINAQLKYANYRGQVAAIARYSDQRQKLRDAGIDKVFNYYAETGSGFAEESLRMLNMEPVNS